MDEVMSSQRGKSQKRQVSEGLRPVFIVTGQAAKTPQPREAAHLMFSRSYLVLDSGTHLTKASIERIPNIKHTELIGRFLNCVATML